MIPVGRLPAAADRAPRVTLPAGACDSHVHVFAGADEFVRDPARTEDPSPGNLAHWADRLRQRMTALGLTRAVVVQSVIYREDSAATVAALRNLGDGFRGIALLRPDVTEARLDHLHDAGFRGVRLDLVYPSALDVAALEFLAPRLVARGWHVQVFGKWATNGAVITELAQRLACPVVLDHFAYPDIEAGVNAPEFRRMLGLLDQGRLWLKLSSLYRQDSDPPGALAPFVAAAAKVNPARLLWGSNWPHVRWDGPMPDEAALIDGVGSILTTAQIDLMFRDNPARLYNFPL